MDEEKRDERQWLYCAECPEGLVFNTAAEVEEALEEGWVDSPARIGEVAVDSDDESDGEPIVDVGGGMFEVTLGDMSGIVEGREAAEAKLLEFQAILG